MADVNEQTTDRVQPMGAGGTWRRDGEPPPQHCRANDSAHGVEIGRSGAGSGLWYGMGYALLAEAVEGGQGMAVGPDMSDEMIARARVASRDLENVLFATAPAEEIPWRDEYFERVLSIESFYYYPDQEVVLRELYRVLVIPGGALVHPHQSLQGKSLFATLGGKVAQGSGARALGGRVRADVARPWIYRHRSSRIFPT